MAPANITVIGSGFGGLAAAIRLRARGFEVTLVERRSSLGGRASRLQKGGFTFDTGPTLITAPFLLERLFQLAGRPLRDYLELIPLDPYYRVCFSDGTSLDYTGDAARMKERLAVRDPRDAGRYDAFFSAIKGIYDAIIRDGLGATPFLSWRAMLRFAPRALRLRALEPVYAFASRFFRDERHRFLFSFHPLFIGGSPFRAPSVYIMIPYLEREAGVWYARGGMFSVVEAMGRLFTEMGGKILTGAPVTEIIVRQGRAAGVRMNAGELAADAVICNADLVFVYKNLIAARWRRRWSDRALQRLSMTMSCFLLYLGVKRKLPQLAHHTLLLGDRYRELVRDVMDRKVLPRDFSMYLHCPSRTDPGMAPPGCESLYCLVPVPNQASGIRWEAEAEGFRERILERLEARLGLTGLAADLEVSEMFTPLNFEADLASFLGNAFGIEPRLSQSAYFRPHNRSEDIRALYFVGASTHPGGGLPGVLLSAEATEKCVLEDFRRG